MRRTADAAGEAAALLELLELSQADVAAGRLFMTEAAFERARRVFEEHEEKNAP